MVPNRFLYLALAPLLFFSVSCSLARRSSPNSVPGQPPHEGASQQSKTQDAKATFYGAQGDGFAGEKTASGEIMDPNKNTAASPTLPLGTRARVTDKETGKSTEVTINDRQPQKKGNSIDLSKKAADDIGLTKKGTDTVKVEVINPK